MTENNAQNVETQVEAADEIVSDIEMKTSQDLSDYIASMIADTSERNARIFTKREGFKSIHSLLSLNPNILATMSGCISYALSEQIADEVEGAKEALSIAIEYANDASSMTANSKKLDSFCRAAIELGYGIDGVAFEDMTSKQKAKIVNEFLSAQKKPTNDPKFQGWVKHLAATA